MKTKDSDVSTKLHTAIYLGGYRSVAAFCRDSNVSRMAFYRAVNGKSLPHPRTVFQMCKQLQCSARKLGFRGYPEFKPDEKQ